MDINKIFNHDILNKNILIIGDIMLDTYYNGIVNRISPEAPVPILEVQNITYKLGGASNIATNIKKLGSNPILCSIIGDDTYGNIIINILNEQNIISDFIIKSDRKTTNKIRIIGNNCQMLRIDDEIKSNINQYQLNQIISNILNIMKNIKIDAIIFEDYDKGLITKELIDFINNMKTNIPIFVDPKFENFHNYQNVKLFKPNLNEFKKGLNNDKINLNDIKLFEFSIENFMTLNNIENMFVTLGDNGIYVSQKIKNNIYHNHITGKKINVSDITGAGDIVISISTLLYLTGMRTIDIANIANLAGGLECQKIGVVPIDKEELISLLSSS